MESKTKQLQALNALRLLAILMVFNSHCGALYPISAFANGGAVGNALFFIISGYLLKTQGNFISWLWNKIARLYPPAIIATVVYLAVNQLYPLTPTEIVTNFILIKSYWFIGAFVCFNILTYVLEHLKVFEHMVLYSVILWTVYGICYLAFVDSSVWRVENGYFRWIYYFYIYTLGFSIRHQKIKSISLSYKKAGTAAVLCFLLNLGIKAVMTKMPLLMHIQFTTQILGMFTAFLALQAVLSAEANYCLLPEKFITVINFFSKMSLEIYLAQKVCIKIAGKLIFPLNLICAIVMTLIYAFLLHIFAVWITPKISVNKTQNKGNTA